MCGCVDCFCDRLKNSQDDICLISKVVIEFGKAKGLNQVLVDISPPGFESARARNVTSLLSQQRTNILKCPLFELTAETGWTPGTLPPIQYLGNSVLWLRLKP